MIGGEGEEGGKDIPGSVEEWIACRLGPFVRGSGGWRGRWW